MGLDGATQICTPYGNAQLKDLVGKSGECYGFDRHSGSVKVVEYTNVRRMQTDAEVWRVMFENGDSMTCAPGQEILVYSKEGGTYVYRESRGLAVWDEVVTTSGRVRVTGIRTLPELSEVYCLEVRPTQNFAVGHGVIVHNTKA